MEESINIEKLSSREAVYKALVPQLKALIEKEKDTIANMANIAAVLKEHLGFFWVGFYRVMGNELVLGPFQGPLACTRIANGKGVCGTVMKQKKPILVPDVNAFPGHIACSSLSQSELVIPVFNFKNELMAVLDLDSDKKNDFTSTDLKYLSEIVQFLY